MTPGSGIIPTIDNDSGSTVQTGRRFQWLTALVTVLGGLTLANAAWTDSNQAITLPDAAPPHFETYTGKDGLADEVWSTVGFDDEGFVWAGSASQLSRFDGYLWHSSAFQRGKGLIGDMATAEDGTLWTIVRGEGLARLRNREWKLDARSYSLSFSILRRPDGRSDLWVDQDNAMHRRVGDDWVLDPGHANLPAGLSRAMARTESLFGEPREWLLRSPDQIWYRTPGDPPGPWRTFEFEALPLAEFSDLVATHDRGREELWILTYGQGFVRLTEEGYDLWPPDAEELPSTAIFSAEASHSPSGLRSLWIASRGGLMRIRKGQLRVFDRGDGLPSDAVRSVKVQSEHDGDQVLWLATESGVARARLEPRAWRTASRLGATENGIFGLLIEPDGEGHERLFIGSVKEGLAMLSRGQWRYFDMSNSNLPTNAIQRIWGLTDADGSPLRLLSLTDGSLLRITDSLRFEPIAVPWTTSAAQTASTDAKQAPHQVVAVAALTHDSPLGHILWVGTRYDGLYRRDSAGWRQIAASPQGETQGVRDLVEQIDAQGHRWIWAASERGIARIRQEDLEFQIVIQDSSEAGTRGLTLIEREDRQELWVATSRRGVLRFDVSDPDDVHQLDSSGIPAPPDPTVYSVVSDSVGRIYTCTNNGVQQLTPRADGGFDERVFRRRDGLVHDECNTGGQAIDQHDRYWVGTLAGLSVYDPALEDRSNEGQVHPLLLTEVRVDGKSIGQPKRLEVPTGTREISVGYSVLSNERESESLYRTQLVGFEETPTPWSTQPARFFSSMPPGSYDLVIEGKNFAGVSSPPLALPVFVAPQWWQHKAVQLAGLAGALTALLGIAILYTRNQRRRQGLLEGIVSTRTKALNAANEKLTLLSNHDPLTGLANRRSLTEQAAVILADAVERRAPVGLILLDIDRFKGFNDRFGHLAGDQALQAVARCLEAHTRSGDVVARFGGEEFACILPNADEPVSHRIAEVLRREVALSTADSMTEARSGVTISAGVVSAMPRHETTLSMLLGAADRALYQAKHEGRNRVVVGSGSRASGRE